MSVFSLIQVYYDEVLLDESVFSAREKLSRNSPSELWTIPFNNVVLSFQNVENKRKAVQ